MKSTPTCWKTVCGGRFPSVWDSVAGDETRVYQYDPDTKQQSVVWALPDENQPMKLQ